MLRLSPGSPPTAVRVIEVLADGFDGRDVTGDPALELTPTTGVVAVEKTPAGPVLRPTATGQTTVGARLGNLTAEPLLVTVGDLAAGLGRLVLTPNPLALWSGETASFSAVMLDPGGGQPLRPIDYKIAALPGQGIVAAAGDQMIQRTRQRRRPRSW